MLNKNLSLQSVTRASAFALLAAVAIGATQPAAAATVHKASVTQSTTLTPTDVSAARRHHQTTRRTSPRNAFGSYVGGADGFTPQSSRGYGYGVGDNSRNQTW